MKVIINGKQINTSASMVDFSYKRKFEEHDYLIGQMFNLYEETTMVLYPLFCDNKYDLASIIKTVEPMMFLGSFVMEQTITSKDVIVCKFLLGDRFLLSAPIEPESFRRSFKEI